MLNVLLRNEDNKLEKKESDVLKLNKLRQTLEQLLALVLWALLVVLALP